MKVFIYLFSFYLCFQNVLASNIQNEIKVANDFYQIGNSKRVVKILENTVESPSFDRLEEGSRVEVYLMLAKSYEQQKNYRESSYFYSKSTELIPAYEEQYLDIVFLTAMNYSMLMTEKRDQTPTEQSLVFFEIFLEVGFDDPRVEIAERKILEAKDTLATYYFEQFGELNWRRGRNYCGAFLAYEDSLNMSSKYARTIKDKLDWCHNKRKCQQALTACLQNFNGEFSNLESL